MTDGEAARLVEGEFADGKAVGRWNGWYPAGGVTMLDRGRRDATLKQAGERRAPGRSPAPAAGGHFTGFGKLDTASSPICLPISEPAIVELRKCTPS